jgi:RNHCP domain
MRPERIEHRKGKGLVIVHRCTGCGAVRPNRLADDQVQGDEIDAITAVMAGLPAWPRPQCRRPPGPATARS